MKRTKTNQKPIPPWHELEKSSVGSLVSPKWSSRAIGHSRCSSGPIIGLPSTWSSSASLAAA